MNTHAPPPLQEVTVLLVDDDPDCRQLVRDALAAGQIHNPVYEVSSGAEALEFLQRQGRHGGAPRPSLVFLDMEMPGMTGQETLQAIRRDPQHADIAVVMFTGVTDDGQKLAALRSGANSYTHKAADPGTFIQTVLLAAHYWLRIHQFPAVRPAECAA